MPTKFYFTSSSPAYISPNFSGGGVGWGGVTGATRHKMFVEKRSQAIVIGSTIDLNPAANSQHLDRQYISQPLLGTGTVSGLCSGQLMVREYSTQDNVNRLCCCLRLVDYYGIQERGILLKLSGQGTIAEFVNNATHRNKIMLSSILSTPITYQNKDRLVLEIGYTSTVGGTTPQASAKWGDVAGDLPVEETQTSDGAGWFLINSDLSFVKDNSFNYFI